MAEKQYMVKASTARKLQRLIRDTPLDATRIDRFREWPPGQSSFKLCLMFESSGSATATPADWKYDVYVEPDFSTPIYQDVVVTVSGNSNPHRYKRPPAGILLPATWGIVVRSEMLGWSQLPPPEPQWPWAVMYAHEVMSATTCTG